MKEPVAEIRQKSDSKREPFCQREHFVTHHGNIICRAVSKTMARRITAALNRYKPSSKGY